MILEFPYTELHTLVWISVKLISMYVNEHAVSYVRSSGYTYLQIFIASYYRKLTIFQINGALQLRTSIHNRAHLGLKSWIGY